MTDSFDEVRDAVGAILQARRTLTRHPTASDLSVVFLRYCHYQPALTEHAARLKVDLTGLHSWAQTVDAELDQASSTFDGDRATWPAAEAVLHRLRAAAAIVAQAHDAPPSAEPTPDPVAVAVAVLRDHPDWSQNRIAREVGIPSSRLTRSPLWRQARQISMGKVPVRGWTDGSGKLEATSEFQKRRRK